MKEKLDEATESALCGGILVALLWGIGVSLRGFVLGPQEISWAEWMTQLVTGVLAGAGRCRPRWCAARPG